MLAAPPLRPNTPTRSLRCRHAAVPAGAITPLPKSARRGAARRWQNGEESNFEAHFKWFGTSGAATFVMVAIMFNSFNDPDIAGNCLNERIAAKCHYD